MMKTLLAILLVVIPVLSNAQSLTGLVASYPFNGSAMDVSANNNDGTLSGPVTSTDRYNYTSSSYDFDGTNDGILIDDSQSLRMTGDFTLMAWFNPRTVKTADIIRKDKSGAGGLAVYRIGISAANKTVAAVNTNTSSILVEHLGYNTNQWQLIAGVVEGSTLSLYVNGALEGQSAITGTITYDTSRVLIGTRTFAPANTFDGRIDDVKVYDRALSAAEILAFFNQTCPDYLKQSNIVLNQNNTWDARFKIEVENVTLNNPFDLNLTAPEVYFDPQITVAEGSDVLIMNEDGCP